MFDAKVLGLIEKVAGEHDIDAPALQSVCWVESAGVAYWSVDGKEMPAIRFEGHYFDQRLEGDEKAKARSLGLASPKAGAVRNPKSYAGRYDLLHRAMAINENAALESISMGIGQVMGAHWQDLGYGSVKDMWDQVCSGVDGQVDAMVRYITDNNLDRALNKRDWKAFAKGYNGPNYAKYRYDKQMADAYARLSSGKGKAATSVSAQRGQTQWVQEKLNLLGYGPLDTDGKMGPKTKAAVKAFQSASGLVADGIPGTLTVNEINADLAQKKEENTKKQLPKVASGLVGGGVAVTTVVDALGDAQDAADTTRSVLDAIGIGGLVAGIIVAGVAGFIVYRLVQRMRFSQPDEQQA